MKFRFGENWKAYSKYALNPERLEQSRSHFYDLISKDILDGAAFLDIGFGQGLALCFASDAGAAAVGLEIDPDNVAALQATLRFFPHLAFPRYEIGSILEPAFVQKHVDRGGYDIVYSWGVLHHTGEMWKAVENAASLVKEDGLLIISLYKKHWTSPYWTRIKRFYNQAPGLLQRGLVLFLVPVIYISKFFVTRQNPVHKERGMSFYYDVVDWVGGFPYEYASQEEVLGFLRLRGFVNLLVRPDAVPTGVIEYVFRKSET